MSITISGSGTITGISSGGLNDNIITDDELNLSANASNIKTALNASGTAPIYACRAWCNFNGTGTVAIRASGNVTGITDNGTGIYKVNFTTAMPDVNYCVVGASGGNLKRSQTAAVGQNTQTGYEYSTTAVSVQNGDPSNAGAPLADVEIFNVAIFR